MGFVRESAREKRAGHSAHDGLPRYLVSFREFELVVIISAGEILLVFVESRS